MCQEAVNITSSRKYDIILMDCNMPIMDGWQATEAIRQSDVSERVRESDVGERE